MFITFILICSLIKKSTAVNSNTLYSTGDSNSNFTFKSIPLPPEPPISESWKIFIKNTTSCDEFLDGTTFDPKKVIDIDWKTFYFWNHYAMQNHDLKFSIPSKMLVDRFRVELENELKPPVNWDDASLFMETSISFSALFIKTNQSGKFRVIPSFAFHYSELPDVTFGLKVVEPGYLGILNCKYRLSYALAPAGNMPTNETCDEEAKKLGFTGHIQLCYLNKPPTTSELEEIHGEHDDDDEENLHMELISSYNENLDATIM